MGIFDAFPAMVADCGFEACHGVGQSECRCDRSHKLFAWSLPAVLIFSCACSGSLSMSCESRVNSGYNLLLFDLGNGTGYWTLSSNGTWQDRFFDQTGPGQVLQLTVPGRLHSTYLQLSGNNTTKHSRQTKGNQTILCSDFTRPYHTTRPDHAKPYLYFCSRACCTPYQ